MYLRKQLTDHQAQLICDKSGLTDKEWIGWIYQCIKEVLETTDHCPETPEDYKRLREKHLQFVKDHGII